MASDKHKELQHTAIRFLWSKGCSVFAEEVPTENGIADALGIQTRTEKCTVYYIEAKISRSDLLCLKQKSVYNRSIGDSKATCSEHNTIRQYDIFYQKKKLSKEDKQSIFSQSNNCSMCNAIRKQHNEIYRDTGIDFYYFIVSDNIKIEPELYPQWGVIDERGNIIRRAKRMKREKDSKSLIAAVAHVLVYKVFGKLYMQ